MAEKIDLNSDENKIMLAILAAGLGSRLKPLTVHHRPKPLFPLGGSVALTELWIKRAKEAGISNISMNLCVLSKAIKDYYQELSQYSDSIKYVEEQTPTGTLGGICKQVLGNKSKKVMENEIVPEIEEFDGTTVLAPSGDIVTNFDADLIKHMYNIHKQKGAAFTMVLCPVPWDEIGEFGTVVLDSPEELKGDISKSGRIVEFLEKDPNSPSNLNNASIYMIEKDLLKILDPIRTEAAVGVHEPFYDFGKHVFPAMLGNLDYVTLPKDCLLWGIQYDGLWFDIGRKPDYISVNKAVLDEDVNVELPYKKKAWGYMGNGGNCDFSKVTIEPPVIIGNECVIEPGAKLGPYCIIGDGWTVEKDACITNSVLWKHYSFYTDDGDEIPADKRKSVDEHRICKGVSIDQCIIVGGTIDNDLQGKTVDVLENGQIDIIPNDWVPEGQRA